MSSTVSPSNAHADFLRQRTFGSLDGLRAISIIGVVWHHTGADTGLRGMTRGFLGVDLFFVISGFLIVSLLLRERRRTGAISLRAFYARRLLRIFPLYYGVLGTLTANSGGNNSSMVLPIICDPGTPIISLKFSLATRTLLSDELTSFIKAYIGECCMKRLNNSLLSLRAYSVFFKSSIVFSSS